MHRSFFNNLAYPKRLINSMLQADFGVSGSESLRFLVNTTIGIAGLYDPANSWFNLHPREKDFGQTLAKWGVPEGSYVTLPVMGGSSYRHAAGSVVDIFFNPLLYTPLGLISIAASGVKTTNMISDNYYTIDTMNKTFADPYMVQKLFFCSRRRLIIKDFDSFKNNMSTINKLYKAEFKKVPAMVGKHHPDEDLADIKINNYHSQSPEIDTFRYLEFTVSDKDKSMWNDMSLWNHEFKNIKKIGSVQINGNSNKLLYEYWMQESKTAPLAYILPGIGSGINSGELDALAKFIYDRKYSVVILPNVMNWEFINAAVGKWLPGYLPEDIKLLQRTLENIHSDLKSSKDLNPSKNILVGVSLGGMHTIKLATEEFKTNHNLKFDRYIAINPPVDLIYGMQVFDKYSKIWENFGPLNQMTIAAILNAKYFMLSKIKHQTLPKNPKDIKEKTIKKNKLAQIYGGEIPFVQSEAEMILSLEAKQTTVEMMYTLYLYDESILQLKLKNHKNLQELYNKIIQFKFIDYTKKILVPFYKKKLGNNFNYMNLKKEANLFSDESTLRNNSSVYILYTVDDIFLNRKHKLWLKQVMRKRCIMFDHGGHLGEMYTEDFQKELDYLIK